MGISSGNGKGFADLVEQNLSGVNQLIQLSGITKTVKAVCSVEGVKALNLRANAMCVHEGHEQIDNLMLNVAIARIQALKHEAECQKIIAEQTETQYKQLRGRLIEIEGVLYQSVDSLGNMKQEVEDKINRLAEQIRCYQKMEQDIASELEKLRKRTEIASEKKRKADTWYYMLIPGYNIYLAVDAYTDSDVLDLQELKSRCEKISVERQQLEEQLSTIERELETDNTELGRCTSELVNVKRSVLRCVEDIGNCGKELGKWNDLYLMYGKIEQDLKNKGMRSEYALKQIYI